MKRFWLALAGFALNRASDRKRGPAWRVARYSTEAEHDAALAKVIGEQITAEVRANPEEQDELRRSLQEAMDGDVRWLTGPETITSTLGGAVTWSTG